MTYDKLIAQYNSLVRQAFLRGEAPLTRKTYSFNWVSPWFDIRDPHGVDRATGLVPLRSYLSTADALRAIDAQHAEEARLEARDAALVRAIGRMG